MAEVKRGFRKVTLVLPVREYEMLIRKAEMEDRDPGQQAAFMLKRLLQPKQGPGLVDEADENGTIPAETLETYLIPDPEEPPEESEVRRQADAAYDRATERLGGSR